MVAGEIGRLDFDSCVVPNWSVSQGAVAHKRSAWSSKLGKQTYIELRPHGSSLERAKHPKPELVAPFNSADLIQVLFPTLTLRARDDHKKGIVKACTK